MSIIHPDVKNTSDKAISRCPDCGAWRWWHRCWTCVPKVVQIHEIEEAS